MMENRISRENRTIARSFRVSERALKVLEEEASRQNTSINALENQLLVQYSEFSRFASRLNTMHISRPILAQILTMGSDEQLVRIARRMGRSISPAYMTSKWGEITPATALGVLYDLSAYGNWFEFNEANENGKRTITLFHELGPKWSLFITHYFSEVFAMTDLRPKVSSTDNSVTFSLKT